MKISRVLLTLLFFSAIALTSAYAEDPLKVVSIFPGGKEVDPSTTKQIIITFDKQMIGLGDGFLSIGKPPVSISPSVKCSWRWLTDRKLACEILSQDSLKKASKYKVKIKRKLKSIKSDRLDKTYTHEFSTVRPRLSYVYFDGEDELGKPSFRINMWRNNDLKKRSLLKSLYFEDAENNRYGIKSKIDKYGELTFWPDKKIDENITIGVYIKPGLRSIEGPLRGVQSELLQKRTTESALEFVGVNCIKVTESDVSPPVFKDKSWQDSRYEEGDKCSTEGVFLEFSTDLPVDDVIENILVNGKPLASKEKASIINSHRNMSEFINLPSLPPGETILLSLRDSAVIQDKHKRLLKNLSCKIETSNYIKKISAPVGDIAFEKGQLDDIDISFINSDKINFSAEVYSTSRGTKVVDEEILSKMLIDNKTHTVSLGLRKKLGDSHGVLSGRLQGESAGDVWPVFAQVTPFNIVARAGVENLFLWVSSLSDARAVENAEVSIFFGGKDQVFKPGKNIKRYYTDNEGTIYISKNDLLALSRRKQQPTDTLFLVVKKGSDAGVLRLGYETVKGNERIFRHEDVWEDETSLGENNGFVWGQASQPVYRPGDTVEFKIYARVLREKGYELPSAESVAHLTIGSESSTIDGFDEKEIRWSRHGTFTGKFIVPESAQGENINFEVNIDDQEFTAFELYVSDYVPQEFGLDFDLQSPYLKAGNDNRATLKASLHNGGPYAGAEARLSASYWGEAYLQDLLGPFEFDDFSFGRSDEDLEIDAFDIEGLTGENGELVFEGDLGLDEYHFGYVEVYSEVEDARGRSVELEASLRYFGRDRFVGIKTTIDTESKVNGDTGQNLIVQAIVIDPDGKALSDIPVRIVVEKEVNIFSDEVEESEGDTDWLAVGECHLTSTNIPVSCEHKYKGGASYRITASITDSEGREQTIVLDDVIYMIGSAYDFSERDNDVLIAPPEVEVGQALKVVVNNPFPKATALITIERMSVIEHKVFYLDKPGFNELLLPIDARSAPLVLLSLTLQKPRFIPENELEDDLHPEILRESAYINVLDPAREVVLNIETDKKLYKPSEKAQVTISSENLSNNETAELTVTIVNEALLQLIGKDLDILYDPTNFYLKDSMGKVEFFLDDNFVSYYSLVFDVKNYSKFAYGGEMEEVIVSARKRNGGVWFDFDSIRSDFKDLAHWSGNVSLIGNKSETINFILPDNLTRWRIFVSAADTKSRFGFAQDSIDVNKATEIRSALPNTLVDGDKLSSRFSVFNRTESERVLQHQVAVDGPIELSGRATGEVTIEPLGRAIIQADTLVTGEGEATFSALAGDKTDQDGIKVTVPVASRSMLERVAVQGVVEPGSHVQIPLAVPEDALADSAHMNVRFNNSLPGAVISALAFGRDYPFRCWEQRLSRAVLAALYLQAPDEVKQSESWDGAAGVIESAQDVAANFQTDNGGMKFYSSKNSYGRESPYLSAYTFLVMRWLSDWGYDFPLDVKNNLDTYLLGIVKHGEVDTLNQIVMALPLMLEESLITPQQFQQVKYKLGDNALSNQIVWLDAEQSLEKILESKSGLEKPYKTMLQNITKRGYQDSSMLSFPLESSGTTQCKFLSAIIRNRAVLGADELEQNLVRGIQALTGSRGHWRNTQENVFCAKALIDQQKDFSREELNLRIKSTIADYPPANINLTESANDEINFASNFLVAEKNPVLDIRAEGSGKAYYNASLSYKKDAKDLPRVSNGISIKRIYQIEKNNKWVTLTPKMILKRGQRVKVQLLLDVPTARHYLVVVDPLPGNLEAVNPEFASMRDLEDEYGFSFYHKVFGLDSVRFYSERTPAGEYRLTYYAQVIAAGEFTALPSTVEAMYIPEVFGRDKSERLRSR